MILSFISSQRTLITKSQITTSSLLLTILFPFITDQSLICHEFHHMLLKNYHKQHLKFIISLAYDLQCKSLSYTKIIRKYQ